MYFKLIFLLYLDLIVYVYIIFVYMLCIMISALKNIECACVWDSILGKSNEIKINRINTVIFSLTLTIEYRSL